MPHDENLPGVVSGQTNGRDGHGPHISHFILLVRCIGALALRLPSCERGVVHNSATPGAHEHNWPDISICSCIVVVVDETMTMQEQIQLSHIKNHEFVVVVVIVVICNNGIPPQTK